MKPFSQRLCVGAALALFLWAAFAAGSCTRPMADEVAEGEPQMRQADFGTVRDNDRERDIYLYPDGNFWGGADWNRFIRYETADDFWWATTPPDPDACTRARVLRSWYSGELRVRAFEGRPRTVHLTVRFKDNLISATSVEFWDGRNFLPLGSLGGRNDHAWKTRAFSVERRRLDVDDGRYRFRLGGGDYGDLMGDLPLDWARVSTAPAELPPDAPGFYPPRPPSPFDDLGRTQIYREGDEPTFPVGVCVKGLRTNSFEVFREARLDPVMLIGWETTWGPRYDVYSGDRWNDRVNAGLPNMLDLARRAGSRFLPCFATDTRSYWIQHQYGSEREALRAMERAMTENANHPNLLAWYLKDEADHQDGTWGTPEEFVQQIYNAQRRADQSRPAFVNFQGWKPGQYPRYLDAADIVGFDVYPIGRGESGQAIADFTDRIREEVNGRRAIWAILEAHEGEHRRNLGRQLSAQEVLIQGYIALVHGIQGVFFYIEDGPRYIDPSEIPGPWEGMRRFAREIEDERGGIQRYLVPPGRTIELAGAGRLIQPGHGSVHASLYEAQDGSRILVAVNVDRQPLSSVRIRCEGLGAGADLPVLFEERSVHAEAGFFTDDFEGFARHVYRVQPPRPAQPDTSD